MPRRRNWRKSPSPTASRASPAPRRIGLLRLLRLPAAIDTAAGVLLLDATLYYWHFLTHRVPLLWRFHRVHHADLDMDASTGIRFHTGELLISVLFRCGQVLLFGVSRRALSIWNTLLLAEVMFHHANIRLTPGLDRWLSLLVVTPRLHGIHHSTRPDELDSNWSSGLTIWDRLGKTLRTTARLPDAQIQIGDARLRHPRSVRFGKMMRLPFVSL